MCIRAVRPPLRASLATLRVRAVAERDSRVDIDELLATAHDDVVDDADALLWRVGGGTSPGASEKFVRAFGPRMCLAAASYARAASSAVSKVPSHNLAPRFGSLISAAQLLG